jgi:uracil-DNA glycosylase
MIDTEKHYIIEAPHPSPLSAYRGFFGSQPFSVINKLLTEQSKKNIHWG